MLRREDVEIAANAEVPRCQDAKMQRPPCTHIRQYREHDREVSEAEALSPCSALYSGATLLVMMFFETWLTNTALQRTSSRLTEPIATTTGI